MPREYSTRPNVEVPGHANWKRLAKTSDVGGPAANVVTTAINPFSCILLCCCCVFCSIVPIVVLVGVAYFRNDRDVETLLEKLRSLYSTNSNN
jgi:hypothetical protein